MLAYDAATPFGGRMFASGTARSANSERSLDHPLNEQEVALVGNPNLWPPATLYVPLRRRDGTVRAYALLSEADRGQARHRWSLNGHGYVHRLLRMHERGADEPPRMVLLHREVLGLPRSDSPTQADHLNKDRLDNRRCNLEPVTLLENVRRQGLCGVGLANTEKTNCPKCGGAYTVKTTSCGETRICRPCASKYQRAYHRNRMQTDSEYAERTRMQRREGSRRHRERQKMTKEGHS